MSPWTPSKQRSGSTDAWTTCGHLIIATRSTHTAYICSHSAERLSSKIKTALSGGAGRWLAVDAAVKGIRELVCYLLAFAFAVALLQAHLDGPRDRLVLVHLFIFFSFDLSGYNRPWS